LVIHFDLGTYALVLRLIQNSTIEVGAMGLFTFQAGFYVYVGSAFGPGGLRARLTHHLSPALHPHWHIDYLRKQADIMDIWFSCEPTRWEHVWAHVFSGMTDALIPFPRFGASDCNCTSHLFLFQSMPDIVLFSEKLRHEYPGHRVVQQVSPNLMMSQ
jgi:Uri superfamily endonuclease